MRVAKYGRTEVAEIEPGRAWSAVGPLAEVTQVLATARQQYGSIASTAPQPAGNGLVLVNFQRRASQPDQRAVPTRAARQPVAPPKPWWIRHWKPLAAASATVLLLAGLGVAWVVAHLDELAAAAVKVFFTLLGIGLVAVLVMAGLSGGGGGSHCPGPFHK